MDGTPKGGIGCGRLVCGQEMAVADSPTFACLHLPETLGQIRARRERLRECVQLPAIGTCLPWVDPTLFNAESLIATIVEADPAAWPKKEATTSEEYHRPDKRVPLPLLCRSVAHDGTPACSPRPGQTLRLDELLGQGYDTPSFVFKCSVLPGGHPVVVKMLTDQNDKLPAGTYIPQEVYANHARWELPGLGMSANMEICNEADRFKDLQTLQGSYVPYSYGFYEVRPSRIFHERTLRYSEGMLIWSPTQFLLPDGYSVPAHIMEYVPTCDIQRFFVEACAPKSVSVDVFVSRLDIDSHLTEVVPNSSMCFCSSLPFIEPTSSFIATALCTMTLPSAIYVCYLQKKEDCNSLCWILPGRVPWLTKLKPVWIGLRPRRHCCTSYSSS